MGLDSRLLGLKPSCEGKVADRLRFFFLRLFIKLKFKIFDYVELVGLLEGNQQLHQLGSIAPQADGNRDLLVKVSRFRFDQGLFLAFEAPVTDFVLEVFEHHPLSFSGRFKGRKTFVEDFLVLFGLIFEVKESPVRIDLIFEFGHLCPGAFDPFGYDADGKNISREEERG